MAEEEVYRIELDESWIKLPKPLLVNLKDGSQTFLEMIKLDQHCRIRNEDGVCVALVCPPDFHAKGGFSSEDLKAIVDGRLADAEAELAKLNKSKTDIDAAVVAEVLDPLKP